MKTRIFAILIAVLGAIAFENFLDVSQTPRTVARTQRQAAAPSSLYYPVSPFFGGLASWYGPRFHGRLTANGERYNMFHLTAAHKSLPLGTLLEVTNLDNGKKIVVRVNDRGPYIHGRSLDLSYGAARQLGFLQRGLMRYNARVLKKTEQVAVK